MPSDFTGTGRNPVFPRARAGLAAIVKALAAATAAAALLLLSVAQLSSLPRCSLPGSAEVARMSEASQAERPFYDLIIAVLVAGGRSPEQLAEVERVRRTYSRYESHVTPNGRSSPLTFRIVFVVGRAELSKEVVVPEEGLLLGDYFHVNIREGYEHLSDKTKAMMALSQHLRFRFLAKTDGDTFPCLARAMQHVVDLPEEDQPRVYAGLLATCGKVFPKGHKLHDPEFIKATGGQLDCHPMYHQGAFYILGEHIVRHLHRSRDLLTVMSVEDAMVGIWLLGIDKVVVDIGGDFYCKCFTHPVPAEKLSFYHFCKNDEKIDGCLKKFGPC